MHRSVLALALAALSHPAVADGDHAAGIQSPATDGAEPAFDIRSAHVHAEGRTLHFHMTVEGAAGAAVPEPAGTLGGAPVWSYVWPTTLDPAVAGFEPGTGILAMAVTIHPDFDDTPLFDEDGDGLPDNDGAAWHSHWVVLVPSEDCGPGALAVRDIPEGSAPALPPTWPGLPLFLDSPGFSPLFDGAALTLRAALAAPVAGAGYDGVTAALSVNESVHAPLLCVTGVFDVASGDLSLPGVID